MAKNPKHQRKKFQLRRKKIIGRKRRHLFGKPLPEPRPPGAPEFLVLAGRGRIIIERGGELHTAFFPAPTKFVKIDCKTNAFSLPLAGCSGIIAENGRAREGQPKAILIHIPPKGRAKEFHGPLTLARESTLKLLQAIPKPTRIELVGGSGRRPQEIEVIKQELRKKGITPIIQSGNTGGTEPRRWLELRPQKGRETVFNYDVKYVLSPKERFKLTGMALGLKGPGLADYIKRNLHEMHATIREGVFTRADAPYFR